MSTLDTLIASRLPDWCDFRRDLHSYPEVGFCEFRTASLIASRLSGLGYGIRMGKDVLEPSSMIGVPSESTLADARTRAIEHGGDPQSIARMEQGMTGIVAELRRGPGPVIAMRFDIDALPVTESQATAHRPHDLQFGSWVAGQMHACGHDGHSIGIGLAKAALEPSTNWCGMLRLIFQPAEEGSSRSISAVTSRVETLHEKPRK